MLRGVIPESSFLKVSAAIVRKRSTRLRTYFVILQLPQLKKSNRVFSTGAALCAIQGQPYGDFIGDAWHIHAPASFARFENSLPIFNRIDYI